jgi:ABC-type Fe3+-siderophore transport system permease subunit
MQDSDRQRQQVPDTRIGAHGAIILLLSVSVPESVVPTGDTVGLLLYLIGGVFFIWLVSRKNGRYLA